METVTLNFSAQFHQGLINNRLASLTSLGTLNYNCAAQWGHFLLCLVFWEVGQMFENKAEKTNPKHLDCKWANATLETNSLTGPILQPKHLDLRQELTQVDKWFTVRLTKVMFSYTQLFKIPPPQKFPH